jgi:hypothetical protein
MEQFLHAEYHVHLYGWDSSSNYKFHSKKQKEKIVLNANSVLVKEIYKYM